jgi:hypothetical protein
MAWRDARGTVHGTVRKQTKMEKRDKSLKINDLQRG